MKLAGNGEAVLVWRDAHDAKWGFAAAEPKPKTVFDHLSFKFGLFTDRNGYVFSSDPSKAGRFGDSPRKGKRGTLEGRNTKNTKIEEDVCV